MISRSMILFIVNLLSLASASQFLVRPMDPGNLMDAQHKDGDTMAEDWGQEYGPKQFQWRKNDPKHGLDDFDKNIARDATSEFDKKHAFPPSAPAGAPGPAY